jgi:hypothetical protein
MEAPHSAAQDFREASLVNATPRAWSIGIYLGQSPFQWLPAPGIDNPVLSSSDVTDVPARFLADPFMVRRDHAWYLFFEVLNKQSDKGEIGLAISDNGFDWTYQQIVLAEPFHLSYPYIFEYDDEFYMVPETLQAEAVCLYKAEDFPRGWRRVDKLIEGDCADPSIFHFDNRWWLFACSTPYEHDTLKLYFADHLTGPWIEHPASPIVHGNKHNARPGGRVLVLNEKIIRFTQDCLPTYGVQLRAFEISELTTTTYAEKENRESPILGDSGSGWNRWGMHHIDPHLLADGQWIACVDGLGLVESEPKSIKVLESTLNRS